MTDYYSVTFNCALADWPRMQRALRAAGFMDLADGGPREFGWTVRLPEAAAASALVEEMRSEGLASWVISHRRRWTASDLRRAQAVAVKVDRAPIGLGGPKYGTAFDLSAACAVCGSGARQTSALVLNRDDVPINGAAFETLDGEVLVAPAIADALRNEGYHGLEVRQAVARDGAPLPWFQLMTESVLPPLSPRTEGVVVDRTLPPCAACGRDGRYATNKQPMLLRMDMAGACEPPADASVTWELFGRSVLRDPLEQSHFATPKLVVTPALYRQLAAAKAIKGVPVEFLTE